MAIDDTLMDSILDDVYNIAGDTATFKGTSIECVATLVTDAEKASGAGDADVIINVQMSVIDALAPSGIAKTDVFAFDGTNYSRIATIEKNEFEYTLAAYKVVT